MSKVENDLYDLLGDDGIKAVKMLGVDWVEVGKDRIVKRSEIQALTFHNADPLWITVRVKGGEVYDIDNFDDLRIFAQKMPVEVDAWCLRHSGFDTEAETA